MVCLLCQLYYVRKTALPAHVFSPGGPLIEVAAVLADRLACCPGCCGGCCVDLLVLAGVVCLLPFPPADSAAHPRTRLSHHQVCIFRVMDMLLVSSFVQMLDATTNTQTAHTLQTPSSMQALALNTHHVQSLPHSVHSRLFAASLVHH